MTGDGSYTFAVRVIPRARKNEVTTRDDGALVVRTTAAPVDGRATEAVRLMVAEHLGVRPRLVTLVAGERSRNKVFRVDAGPT